MTQSQHDNHDSHDSLRDCHRACGVAKRLGHHSDRLSHLESRIHSHCYGQDTDGATGQGDKQRPCPLDNEWCNHLREVQTFRQELLTHQQDYHQQCLSAAKKGSPDKEKVDDHQGTMKKKGGGGEDVHGVHGK